MIEVSAHGCRLIARERFRLGDRVHLRVSAALTGSGDLRLRGRVVRRDRLASTGAAESQIALQFERLSGRSTAHLDALLAERASGPSAVEGATATGTDSVRRRRRGPSRFLTLTQAEEAPAAGTPPPAPALERRREPRGRWSQELVALEAGTDRALHTLLGSDLSLGGVRVEPHPLLRIGDRLRLALYDAGHAEPLVLEARVAYDAGRRGVGLVFQDVAAELQQRLRAMVAALPPVSSLSGEDEKPRDVVLGEILALEDSALGREHDQREPEHDHGAADHHDSEAQTSDEEPAQD